MRQIGAHYKGDRCEFVVWAPEKSSMILHIVWPEERKVNMTIDNLGYFSVELTDVHAGHKYYYRPEDENDYPDPASFYQPDGVHGPSTVVDHRSFPWAKKEKAGVELDEY